MKWLKTAWGLSISGKGASSACGILILLFAAVPAGEAQSIFDWFANLVRSINHRFILWNGSVFPVSQLDRDAKLATGGEYVSSRANHEHMVRIMIEYPGGRRVLCSGALIHPRFVLTAAHCLQNADSISKAKWDKIATVAGDQEVYRREDVESVRMVKTAHLHEAYVPVTRANDLALLELEQPHDLKPNFIAEARLPEFGQQQLLDEENWRPKVNTTLMTAGWTVNLNNGDQGPRVGLKEAVFDVIPLENCNTGSLGAVVDQNSVCLRSRDRRSCFGEDGGPLLGPQKFALGGFSLVVAVNSYAEYSFDDEGQIFCNGTAPARATLVGPSLSWINSFISSNSNGTADLPVTAAANTTEKNGTPGNNSRTNRWF